MRKFRIIIAFIILGIGLMAAYQYGTVKEVEITVTDKERVVKGNGDGGVDSKYLVFTEDEVYENTDALFHGKFRSSNIQGKLEVGGTYKVKVFGWRAGVLSMYPNIIKIIE